jgi:hypothetical protein
LGIGCAAEQPQPAQSTAAASKFSQDDEIEARFQRIIRSYGDRLSEEQRNRLRKILAYNERLLKPIRDFPIENGQPPAPVLKVYADPTAKPHPVGRGRQRSSQDVRRR